MGTHTELILVSLLCLCGIVFLLYRVATSQRDLFDPGISFFFSHLATLGIAYLQLLPAMTPFATTTWLVLLSTALCYLFGLSIVRIYGREFYHKPDRTPIRQALALQLQNYRWDRHLIGAFVLMLCNFPMYALVWKFAGGLPILSDKASSVMSTTGLAQFGVLNIFAVSGPLPTMLFMLASFRSINPHKNLRLIARWMSLVALVVSTSFFISRLNLFVTLIYFLVLWHYLHGPIKLKFIAIAPAAIIGLFIAIGMTRSQFDGQDDKGVQRLMWAMPYAYIANDYWNLNHALLERPDKEIHPFKWGQGLIDAPCYALRVCGGIGKAYNFDTIFNGSIEKIRGYNTVTFHWSLYTDMGWLGVTLFPFAFGLVVGWIYYRFKTRPTLGLLAWLGTFTYIMVLSHHDEFYHIISFHYWAWASYAVIRWSYPPKHLSKLST